MGVTVTSIKVDEELWKELKIAAIRENKEVGAVTNEAIAEWLQKKKYFIGRK